MKELIECHACGVPGLLRLDAHPAHIEHGRGKSRCELPPRDSIKRPRVRAVATPGPKPILAGWIAS